MGRQKVQWKIWTTLLILAVAAIAGICVGKQKKRGNLDEITEQVLPDASAYEKKPASEYPYMIAACMEYMSLREQPGLDTPVIEKIYPATLLEWLGETVEKDGLEFCRVRNSKTGKEGYCSARYCILTEYLYDENRLSIVGTEDAFYTYEQMKIDLNEMAKAYPECVKVSTCGTTLENREIYQVILGNPEAEHAIFIQGGIHGREYMSSQLIMKMIEYYAAFCKEGTYKERNYEELFSDTVFYAIPMSNPDGVSISQFGENAVTDQVRIRMMQDAYERDQRTLIYIEDSNGDHMWYDAYDWKNFEKEAAGYPDIISYEDYLKQWKGNASGVDINRNFDAGWEEIQQKDFPGAAFFKGNRAGSEIETQILMSAVRQRKFDCVISYHARGQLIYYDTYGVTEELSEKSQKLAQTCERLVGYRTVNTKESTNVVMGGLSDWVMLELGIPAFTIEIGKRPCPLQSDEFNSIWIRNRELWAKLAYEMLSK